MLSLVKKSLDYREYLFDTESDSSLTLPKWLAELVPLTDLPHPFPVTVQIEDHIVEDEFDLSSFKLMDTIPVLSDDFPSSIKHRLKTLLNKTNENISPIEEDGDDEDFEYMDMFQSSHYHQQLEHYKELLKYTPTEKSSTILLDTFKHLKRLYQEKLEQLKYLEQISHQQQQNISATADLPVQLLTQQQQQLSTFRLCSYTEGISTKYYKAPRCQQKAIPLTNHCLKHILNDTEQVLFEKCQGDENCQTILIKNDQKQLIKQCLIHPVL
ncbi:unnamed protein product [Didymodactylos carnosus]|nr:unnamed protein product [Didymodactylos carnosus]CAF4176207.1 unnamed protein product [Didymodactylos carnosus]